jgi:hypothetical protein
MNQNHPDHVCRKLWIKANRFAHEIVHSGDGLPLRAIISILSYAPNSLPCGVGNSERLLNIAKRVLRPSANSRCVKIASAMSVANERLLDRVRHFVEPRLAILAFG